MIPQKTAWSVIVAIVLNGNPGFVEAESRYPSACCPELCKPINKFREINEGFVEVGTKRLPVSERVFRGASQDNKYHACVGYDMFGNEEVKCIFEPLLTM